MVVCSRCFEPYCNCKQKKIEIDDMLHWALRELNRKGYKTEFSCSGHADDPEAYICFNRLYLFESVGIPDGFYLVQDNTYRLYPRTIIYSKDKDDLDKELENEFTLMAYLAKVNNQFYNWAKSLPDLNSKEDESDTRHEQYSVKIINKNCISKAL